MPAACPPGCAHALARRGQPLLDEPVPRAGRAHRPGGERQPQSDPGPGAGRCRPPPGPGARPPAAARPGGRWLAALPAPPPGLARTPEDLLERATVDLANRESIAACIGAA